MSFELIILGSSSALPTSKRFPTAHLLKVDERFFLVDCGEGTQVQLRRYGFSPGRIHHIFISHLHGDHVFGLYGLLSTMGMLGRKTLVHLYGPEGLEKMLNSHFSFFVRPSFELQYHVPVGDPGRCILDDGKVEVYAIPLKHRVETYGYLFREKARPLNVRKEKIGELGIGLADVVRIKAGEDFLDASGKWHANRDLTLDPYRQRSYAYVSDTVFDPSIAEHITGVGLLFHEATFAGKDSKLAHETMHSTSLQAAEIARRAGAGKLLIGHFSSRYKNPDMLVEEARSIFPQTSGVKDGDVHSLPQTRMGRE